MPEASCGAVRADRSDGKGTLAKSGLGIADIAAFEVTGPSRPCAASGLLVTGEIVHVDASR